MTFPHRRARWLPLVALFYPSITSFVVAQQQISPPTLEGKQHFRVTVVAEGSFITMDEAEESSPRFSGYLIQMLDAISRPDRANFTYELLTPSGFGSFCRPQLSPSLNQSSSEYLPFSAQYHKQYNCATSDVTEVYPNATGFRPTDMYLGMFYITANRLLRNHFTIPFSPPYKGTPAMMGTAVKIRTIDELLVQQAEGLQPPVCIRGSSATYDFIQASLPELKIKEFFGTEEDRYDAIYSGDCPIFIGDAPLAAEFVSRQKMKNECFDHKGMPIGIIGDPMEHGLSHYAIGISKDLPISVVDTISYWMNFLMTCSPEACPDGNLGSYALQIGTGRECGYMLFPPEPHGLGINAAEMSGILIAVAVVVLVPLLLWHRCRIRRQQRRYKIRFVQQIARNIQIGPRPGQIPPEKLAEEILHIGQGKGTIGKEDLRQWIHDIKMNFISESDFNALWSAIDIDDTGVVDPVQFIVFLSACGPEFELVYNEQKNLPKSERVKLATRRLTNIALYGDVGVRKLENRLEKRGCMSPQRSIDVSSAGSQQQHVQTQLPRIVDLNSDAR